MIEVIKKIITKVPNITGLGISFFHYAYLLRNDEVHINIRFHVDKSTVSICTAFGVPIFIFNEIENEHFRISLSDPMSWSNDINILDIDKIDRILKLQVFA